jgi:hypothetical protein
MIHNLGIETVPVDESSDDAPPLADKGTVEPIPSSALAARSRFSTRLFD